MLSGTGEKTDVIHLSKTVYLCKKDQKMKKPVVPIPEIKTIPLPKSVQNKKIDPNFSYSKYTGILANDKTAVKAAKKRTID